MKTAKEMRTITTKAIKTANEIKRKKAIEYVESEIAPKIEEIANCGGSIMKYRVDSNIDIKTVIEFLVDNEYIVRSSEHDIQILWSY